MSLGQPDGGPSPILMVLVVGAILVGIVFGLWLFGVMT
jgi:hypothetical protein